MKVWDRARIELIAPGSAVRHVSAIRHFTETNSNQRRRQTLLCQIDVPTLIQSK